MHGSHRFYMTTQLFIYKGTIGDLSDSAMVIYVTQEQSNAPINVPHLGRKWGFTEGIDTKLLPHVHYGAFDDRSVSTQIFFVVTSFAMSNPE